MDVKYVKLGQMHLQQYAEMPGQDSNRLDSDGDQVCAIHHRGKME